MEEPYARSKETCNKETSREEKTGRKEETRGKKASKEELKEKRPETGAFLLSMEKFPAVYYEILPRDAVGFDKQAYSISHVVFFGGLLNQA